MKHEHDFDLIAALAEGPIPRDDSVLAGCPQCLEELEMQRLALGALRSAPRPAMTELERTRLHQVVAAVTATAKKEKTTARAPWFQRLMPAMAAAAALLVVVGIGSVLVGGPGEGADDEAETTFAEAATTTTQMADTEPAVQEDMAEGMPAETTTAPALAAVPTVEDFGIVSNTELQERAAALQDTQRVAEESLGFSAEELFDIAQASELLCAEEAAEAAGDAIVAIARAVVDGQKVEIYVVDGPVTYVFETSNCALIDQLG